MSEPVAPGRSPLSRAWPALVPLVLLLAVLAAHGGGLDATFQYDDKVEILINPNLQGLGHWREIWIYNPFRFLLLCTFALQYNLTGDSPVPFHVANLAIHLLNALLVASLARRLLGRVGPAPFRTGWGLRLAALASALLFAVHPLLVEGVTYISGRSSSLATTMYLLAFVVLDSLLRRETASSDGGARFRAVAGRVALLLTLAIVAVLVGAVVAAHLWRTGVVPSGRAVPLGLGATLLTAGAMSGLVRRLLRTPLPVGPPTGPLTTRWVLLAVLFVVGAMVKEIVVTLPVGLWLWDLCVHRQGRWRDGLRRAGGIYLPLIAGPLGLALFRLAYYGTLRDTTLVRPYLVNLWTEAVVVWRYAGLFLWPADQSIFHHHPESLSLLSWPAAAAVAAWIILISVVIAGLARWPGLGFVVLWSLVALAPSSSIIPLKETMAEHRAYLPMTAWCLLPILVAGRLPRLRAPPWLLPVLLAAISVALAVQTVRYTRDWSTEEGLWRRAVELNPDAAPAWYMLGDIALSEHRLNAARESYQRCLETDPTFHDAANKLGWVHLEYGDLRGAHAQFIRAADIAAASGRCAPAAYNNIGNVLFQARSYLEARRAYLQALDCDEDNYVGHVRLGDLYEGPLDDRERALIHYRRAIRIQPTHATSRRLLATIDELSQ